MKAYAIVIVQFTALAHVSVRKNYVRALNTLHAKFDRIGNGVRFRRIMRI